MCACARVPTVMGGVGESGGREAVGAREREGGGVLICCLPL